MFEPVIFSVTSGFSEVIKTGEKMVSTIYLSPKDDIPTDRHVAVIVHRDHGGLEKGYFYDSAQGDSGGSGPFDLRMDEAIERAKRFASDLGLETVVVRTARF